jgi:hypothetical protein
MYRLLKEGGYGSVELFDVHRSNTCRQKPCAWGVAPRSEYHRLVSRFGDPALYELTHYTTIAIDDLRLKADMTTVDKPRLIDDLIGGDPVRREVLRVGDFDRVVDATGCERSFLGPPVGPEMIAQCSQYRIRSVEDLGFWFRTTGLGYEWCFPLGRDEYHIGFGNLGDGVAEYRPSEDRDGRDVKGEVLCRCFSRIRLSSPHYSQPFTLGEKIIGVGESIGTVGPLGGDGNLYSMQCAEMLVKNWDDPAAYTAGVLKRYDWMRKEREALEKMLRGRIPPVRDIRVFLSHSKRVGVKMGPVQALGLFKRSLETSRGRGPARGNGG